MKVVVVGAGGLGACLAAQLNRAGQDVTLVARGEHRDAIERDGLQVRFGSREEHYRIPTVSDLREAAGSDVFFVAVKQFSLDPLIPDLVEVAHRGGLIVPLLNGVDAGERLRAGGVPAPALAEGIAYLTGFRLGPGMVERIGDHGRIVLADTGDAPRVASLRNLLLSSGLDAEMSSRIEVLLWRKMGVVCTLNAVCVLFGGELGRVREHPYGRVVMEQASREVVDVARSRGVNLDATESQSVCARVGAFEPDFYPSLLHDLRQGHRTEINSLNGALCRWAASAGASVPVHEAVVAAVASWGDPTS